MKGDNLAAVKQINAAIPVLICSGYSRPALKANEAVMPVDGYIDKPITFEKLARAVRRVISDRK